MFVVLGLGLVVVLVRGSDGGSSAAADAAQQTAVFASVHALDQPRESALAALASQRLEPSLESELAMLDVAGTQWGVKRVIRTGSPQVEAAVRVRNLLVTAGSDRLLRVWRISDGELIGETRTPRVLTQMAVAEETSLVAGSDEEGHVVLVDVSPLPQPQIRALRSTLETEDGLLAFDYSADGTRLLGFDGAGTLSRLDLVTDTVSHDPLPVLASHLHLGDRWVVARLETGYEEVLLAVSRDGGAARLDLETSRVALTAAAGILPGEPTSVTGESYPATMVVGATGGTMLVGGEYETPLALAGQGTVDLAFDDEDEGIWVGDLNGITRVSSPGAEGSPPAPAGGAVERLSESEGALAALHEHGVVSLLEGGSGLSLPDAEPTPVGVFGPAGEVLVADGYDANHIEKLKTLRPGYAEVEGLTVQNPDLRHYRPDPDWWPDAEDEEALYVNDAAIDEQFVVAAGQDPTGEAVVLIWDTESGEPLQRLGLGTGGVETTEPSMVTEVILIPGKDLIAAYSAVQQLVVFWSTESWEQVDAVPVGQAGDLALSPDESTLLVAGTAEEGAEYEEVHRSSLIFVDVDRAEVADEVATGNTYRAAYSPSGDRLVTIGFDAALRIRSADGRHQMSKPTYLDALPVSLAWRPDEKVIAVALENGDLVLVPSEGGLEPVTLSDGPTAGALGLSWSPDGTRLAAATSVYDDDGGRDPAPLRLWTLSARRLERRMCQLAGGSASRAEWRTLVIEDLPPLALCRRHDSITGSADAVEQGPAIVAFRARGRLFTADAAGRTRPLGELEEWPPPAFAWSGGDLGWVADGKTNILRAGAAGPEWWPCICSGVAWRNGALVSIAEDGGRLLEFVRGRRLPRVTPTERHLGAPSMLGFVGEWAIVGTREASPSFTELEMVDAEGGVRHLLDTAGGIVGQAAPSPRGDRLVYSTYWNDGPCISSAAVGVLTEKPNGGVSVFLPGLPGPGKILDARSVQMFEDGATAAVGPLGCREGLPSDPRPPAARYELRGERWVPTGERGADVQLADGRLLTLSANGELRLRDDGGGELLVADDVEMMVGRP